MYGFKPEELADVDILASYYYIRNCKPLAEGWRGARDFLCDSGLFTFVNTGVRVDLQSYAEARGYFKACDWLSIGLVGTSYWSYSYNPDFGLYLALKINL